MFTLSIPLFVDTIRKMIRANYDREVALAIGCVLDNPQRCRRVHAESVRWLIMRFRSNWIIEAAPCFSSFHSSSSESSRPPSSNHDVSHLSASLSLCLYSDWCSPRILCSFVSFVVSRISKESADRWFVADSADRSGLMGGPYLWMALQHQWDALVSLSLIVLS